MVQSVSADCGQEVSGTVLGADFVPNIGYLTFTDNAHFGGVEVTLVLKQAPAKASASCGDGAVEETAAADVSDQSARSLTLSKISYDKVWWQRYVKRAFVPNVYTFEDTNTAGASIGSWDYFDEGASGLGGYTDIKFDQVDPDSQIISGAFFAESYLDKDGNELETPESIEGDFAVKYCNFTGGQYWFLVIKLKKDRIRMRSFFFRLNQAAGLPLPRFCVMPAFAFDRTCMETSLSCLFACFVVCLLLTKPPSSK